MEVLEKFWAEYGALITGIITTIFGGGLGVFLGRFAGTAAANKLTGKFDVNFMVAEITEKVTQKVVKAITGSVIDVDISAIVNKKLDETLGEITLEIKGVKEAVSSVKECQALTAKAVSKSKLLDKMEQAALAGEAEKLSDQVVREQKTVTKIKLENSKPLKLENTDTRIMSL